MSFLLFSPDGLRLAISHQPSSSESAAASSGADSNHRQPSPVDNLLHTIDSGIESGHDTPYRFLRATFLIAFPQFLWLDLLVATALSWMKSWRRKVEKMVQLHMVLRST
jgi:hypothetical protein